MQQFCFLCGKKTEKLIEGYCEECYEREFKLIKAPEKIFINACSNCGKIKEENKWKDMKLEVAIANKIKILGNDVSLTMEKTDDIFHIYAKGFLKNHTHEKEERHHTRVHVNKMLCPDCTKERTGYYQSILQLRGKITDEILDFTDKQISEKSFYKVKEVKGGIDLYIGKKSVAESTANTLKKSFKAEVKKSFKQVSKKEGKNVYTDVISVRI